MNIALRRKNYNKKKYNFLRTFKLRRAFEKIGKLYEVTLMQL